MLTKVLTHDNNSSSGREAPQLLATAAVDFSALDGLLIYDVPSKIFVSVMFNRAECCAVSYLFECSTLGGLYI